MCRVGDTHDEEVKQHENEKMHRTITFLFGLVQICATMTQQSVMQCYTKNAASVSFAECFTMFYSLQPVSDKCVIYNVINFYNA